MEDKKIVDGNLGTVGKYDVEFKDGKLVAEVLANLPVGSAGLKVEIGGAQLLDALKRAIPGQIDDAVIDVLKAALGLEQPAPAPAPAPAA